MIKDIFRLIRLPNLLIVAFTQLLIRYMVIDPFLKINNFHLQLSTLNFIILVLSTLCIAAAGYAINDYFDTRTDRLNKPDKVVIDRKISRRTAIKIHTILNVIGVGLGIWLSVKIGVLGLSLIYFLAAGLLWFYSTNYKRQFLIGNFIVSFLTAMVPLLVVIYEIPLLNKAYGELMIRAGANFNYIFYWVSGFSFFAFLSNFIREIIKDAEDFEGDSAYGMNTLPIMLGINYTKIILLILIVAFNAVLAWVVYQYIYKTGSGFDILSALYFLILIGIPSLLVLILIFTAKGKNNYKWSSFLMKIIMLAGLLYSLVVYYNLHFRLNM